MRAVLCRFEHVVGTQPINPLIDVILKKTEDAMRHAGVVILLVVLALTGAGRASWAQAPTTLKVGTISIMDDIGLFVAMERGYFAEKGLKVELVPIAGAGDIMAMLASNQLEFAGGGITISLMNAVARGLPIRAIAPRTILIPGHDHNVIMVRPDLAETIKSPRDLKGRKFAINSPVSSAIYVVAKMMESVGLSLKDLDVVSMPFPQMGTALGTKAIEAAFQVEPFATLLQEKGVAIRWKGSTDFVYNPFMAIAAYLVSHEWASRNQKIVQDFVTQYLRGVRVYYEALTTGKNRDEVIALLTKYTAGKDRGLYDRMTWTFVDPNGYIVKRSVDDQVDWYFRAGMITKRLSVDQIVDLQYVERALKEIGTVTCPKCVQ